MRRLPAVLAFVIAAVCTAGAHAQSQAIRWEGFTFIVPSAFQGPERLGPGAASLTLPGSGPGRFRFEIVIVLMDREQVDAIGAKDLMPYFRSTYLASATPATGTKERNFLGAPVRGETFSTSIPFALDAEAYLVPLPDGGRLGIGLRGAKDLPPGNAENIAAAFAASLKRSD